MVLHSNHHCDICQQQEQEKTRELPHTHKENMGNTTSSTTTVRAANKAENPPPFCEDCQKDKQQPLPAQDNISSNGQPCASLYELVDKCMIANAGQISLCKNEWDMFRHCHETNKPQRT